MSFDYKIAADFCCGRKVSGEDARNFAHHARDDYEKAECELVEIERLRRELERRDAEIYILKRALLENEEVVHNVGINPPQPQR